MQIRQIAAVVCLLACSAAVGARERRPVTTPPQELARIWDAEHVSPPLPPLVDHAEVVKRLNALVVATPDLFSMEKIGESVEGRAINHVRVGRGSFGETRM